MDFVLAMPVYYDSRPCSEAVPWLSAMAGVVFVWQNKILLSATSLDLFAVLLGGAVAHVVPCGQCVASSRGGVLFGRGGFGVSNHLGEFESGGMGALWGPVVSVVSCGVNSVMIAVAWLKLFQVLAKRDRKM